MSKLQDNLTEIKRQKDLYLLPENIKAGVVVLGVTGTYESIDTSDATATVEDLAQGKTAYVNGQKITGNLADLRDQTLYIYDVDAVDDPNFNIVEIERKCRFSYNRWWYVWNSSIKG